MSFEDCAPNVKANMSPTHGNSFVNMVDGCPDEYKVYDVRRIQRPLVELHKTLCQICECEHDHDGSIICSVNPRGYVTMKRDIHRLVDEGMIHIHQARNQEDDVNVIVPVFKTPERGVIQYDSSKGSNRSISPWARGSSSRNYFSSKHCDVVKVTQSGRVFSPVFPKVVENVVVGKKAKVVIPVFDHVNTPIGQSGESSGLKIKDDNDEVLYFIKKGSLTSWIDQFDHIVPNMTACSNMSFCDEELPKEGRNHNLTLHISKNYKEEALSNVLVETGSSLNVLPKSTLSRLSYQGAPRRYSGVIVKEFDGSHKIVIGKNGKLVIIGGEKELLVSHLSSFTYVEAEEAIGTLFQALYVDNMIQKTKASMSSLKDAQEIIQAGDTDNWGRVVEVVKNKNWADLRFEEGPFKKEVKAMQ
ncbi:uncharacterized protein LOC127131612 [Lathyrus oleraceus]|uniref:uncharacterized protein LOC127131612 n=1 Tax=Pisum sativum TaxID=3888 RepID=UPI0021D0DE5E|nr:uncharacterized protein LOC127131612 [Pisum sativum]